MYRRFIHRRLMRGHVANRAGILLLIGLLTVLAVAVFHGLRSLPLS